MFIEGQLFYEVGVDDIAKSQDRFESVMFEAKDIIHIRGLGSDGIVGYSIFRIAEMNPINI